MIYDESGIMVSVESGRPCHTEEKLILSNIGPLLSSLQPRECHSDQARRSRLPFISCKAGQEYLSAEYNVVRA